MINEIMKYSLSLSALASIILWFFVQEINAVAPFIGTLWGITNLYFISQLAKTILITKNYFLTSLLLMIKFPLLYFIGYCLLNAEIWNPWLVAAGFPIIFLAAVISSWLQPSGKLI